MAFFYLTYGPLDSASLIPVIHEFLSYIWSKIIDFNKILRWMRFNQRNRIGIWKELGNVYLRQNVSLAFFTIYFLAEDTTCYRRIDAVGSSNREKIKLSKRRRESSLGFWYEPAKTTAAQWQKYAFQRLLTKYDPYIFREFPGIYFTDPFPSFLPCAEMKFVYFYDRLEWILLMFNAT